VNTIHEKHLALVDAVNDANTEAEHRDASNMLCRFRRGLEAAGVRPDLIACDLYTMEKHGEDREMVCGVLLDWKPSNETN